MDTFIRCCCKLAWMAVFEPYISGAVMAFRLLREYVFFWEFVFKNSSVIKNSEVCTNMFFATAFLIV